MMKADMVTIPLGMEVAMVGSNFNDNSEGGHHHGPPMQTRLRDKDDF